MIYRYPCRHCPETIVRLKSDGPWVHEVGWRLELEQIYPLGHPAELDLRVNAQGGGEAMPDEQSRNA